MGFFDELKKVVIGDDEDEEEKKRRKAAEAAKTRASNPFLSRLDKYNQILDQAQK